MTAAAHNSAGEARVILRKGRARPLWTISSSYSKSEIARRPLTIARAPTLRAKSTTRVSNGSARDVAEVRGRVLDERDPLLGREQRLGLAHRSG